MTGPKQPGAHLSVSEDELVALAPRLNRAGPRYTSYPTAVDFGDEVDAAAYERRLDAVADAPGDWSVYVHVPFCQARCRFCACSVVVSPDPGRVVDPYLSRLEREIDMVGARLGQRRRVAQLHLGGGTPTYLEPERLTGLHQHLLRHFELTPDAEVSVEVDPRVTTPAHLEALAGSGFNRISVGVQDFDPEVQALIGRIQPYDVTAELVERSRRLGFESVNVDLVYGLPGQTAERFDATLRSTIELGPDRIALYGYAHMPWARGNQRAIDPATLPDGEARIAAWAHARAVLSEAGWAIIGMDHFARPDDELAVADADGRLRRNFMGYGVASGDDILGFGLTAIGNVGGAFVQNTRKLVDYYRRVDAGQLPVERGLVRTADDELRAQVISDLMCRHGVSRADVEARFPTLLADGFDRYFDEDLRDLAEPIALGLVEDDGERLELTALGRAFVRNVAMCFDARLRSRRRATARKSHLPVVDAPKFSQTV